MSSAPRQAQGTTAAWADDEVMASDGAPPSLVHLVAARTATGATAVQVARLAIRQAERGAAVAVLARPALLEALGADRRVQRCGAALRTPLDPLTILRVRRTLQRLRPAVVHAHSAAAAVAVRLGLAGKAVVPLIVTHRLMMAPGLFTAPVLRSRALHANLTSCKAVARLLATTRLPPARVRVCPDGADLSWLAAANTRARKARASLAFGSASPLVVHAGVRSWRGGGEMLRAWPRVVRHLPGARLLLTSCSFPGDRHEVLDLASEMGVADSVEVTGQGFEAPEWLAAADVVADASWAGAGVSAAVRDAMALGKPVVAVARDGNLELVHAGVTGLLVPPRDPSTLAAAVIRLATDQTLARRLAAAASSQVQREWSLDHQLAELDTLYREAVLHHLGLGFMPAGR